MSRCVRIELLRSWLAIEPGPTVAGPDVKSMTRDPVWTEHASRRAIDTSTAFPVHRGGRWPDLSGGERWMSSMAVAMLNSHSEIGNMRLCFCEPCGFPSCCLVPRRSII